MTLKKTPLASGTYTLFVEGYDGRVAWASVRVAGEGPLQVTLPLRAGRGATFLSREGRGFVVRTPAGEVLRAAAAVRGKVTLVLPRGPLQVAVRGKEGPLLDLPAGAGAAVVDLDRGRVWVAGGER